MRLPCPALPCPVPELTLSIHVSSYHWTIASQLSMSVANQVGTLVQQIHLDPDGSDCERFFRCVYLIIRLYDWVGSIPINWGDIDFDRLIQYIYVYMYVYVYIFYLLQQKRVNKRMWVILELPIRMLRYKISMNGSGWVTDVT